MAWSNQGPTMKEVAARAQVAISSVSRVLNSHPDVSDSMRRRVLQVVDEMGYEPDLLASSLRKGATHTVGFLIRDVSNPLFMEVLKGVERLLRTEGYLVLLAHSEGSSEREVAYARLLRQRRIDGLIFSMSEEQSPEVGAELSKLNTPIVLLDRAADGVSNVSVVASDHRTGVRRATEHLLDLGHRRIALITSTMNLLPARERVQGLRDGFERRGLQPPEHLLRCGSFSMEYGTRSTEELFDGAEPPTAIIAGGNVIFTGVVSETHRRGLRIGRDLSVITCDDTPLAQFHTPPVTAVARDAMEMGATAARLLLAHLRDPDEPARTVTLPTELILRESTHRIS